MTDISKHFEEAEKHLAIALAMMLDDAGTAKVMQGGRRWIGSWTEVRKTAKAMLSVRGLAERLRFLESPRKTSPALLALRPENQRITPVRFKCLACGEYHEGSGNLPCPSMSPYSRIEQ